VGTVVAGVIVSFRLLTVHSDKISLVHIANMALLLLRLLVEICSFLLVMVTISMLGLLFCIKMLILRLWRVA